MKFALKPLDQQVILITGASSGIGLTTARGAAERGAKVVLVARSEPALREAVDDIQGVGGEVAYAVADVADLDEFRRAADLAIDRFGRIDTWINNAGVSIYGRVEEINVNDDRRLFETNFWGVVNGSRLAIDYLTRGADGGGGALINVGSIVSDRAVPLQTMYSASKHAVQGFTDGLRMEVEKEGLPIAVTLIKPSAIDTPFPEHAKNYMDVEPTFPPPVYKPEIVADQILYAAEHPVRELYAGGGGRVLAGMGKQMPRVMDWIMELLMFRQQQSDRPAREDREGSLYEPGNDERQYGPASRDRMVRSTSLYGPVSRHPFMTMAVLLGVGALGLTVASALMQERQPPRRRGGGRGGRAGHRPARVGFARNVVGVGADAIRRGRQIMQNLRPHSGGHTTRERSSHGQ